MSATSRSLLEFVLVKGFLGRNATRVAEGISDHKTVFLTLEFPRIKANKWVSTLLYFTVADDTAIVDHLDLRLRDFYGGRGEKLNCFGINLRQSYIRAFKNMLQRNARKPTEMITRNTIHRQRMITRKRRQQMCQPLCLLIKTGKDPVGKACNLICWQTERVLSLGWTMLRWQSCWVAWLVSYSCFPNTKTCSQC